MRFYRHRQTHIALYSLQLSERNTVAIQGEAIWSDFGIADWQTIGKYPDSKSGARKLTFRAGELVNDTRITVLSSKVPDSTHLGILGRQDSFASPNAPTI